MSFKTFAAAVTAAVALAAAVTVVHAQNAAVTVTVDPGADRRPINPAIYGVAHATAAQLQDLNAPLNRYGGNNTSRYNWQLNADNRGMDWYFQSIPEASATPGQRGDDFVLTSRAGGAEPMITIPIIEYVAKLGANRAKLASFDSRIYGAQDDCDWQWFPTACNGMRGGAPITGNNPLDANVLNSTTLQGGWVSHLVQRFGQANGGGVRYYILDNEYSIWHSTHRDVWPTGATMEQVRDMMVTYASTIKNADPTALVVGPEEWGWSGYTLSGYDQQYGARHGWSFLPDRAAHGGMDYLPWLLQELRQRSELDGRRVLDVFTVHYYPQGGEFWSDDVSAAMQLRRNRSTRSLWDPNYTDETWINDKVRLIPRLRSWVNTYYYAGTPIGITEYNWGAEGHINGATAQADIYGIFGREGLDLAARWTTPASSTPTYKAMQMYRNYDGNRSTFGDTSVRAASSANADSLSVFAAERSTDGALTVMVVSKVLSGATPVTVNLMNFAPAGSAQVWQLTSANSIARLADVPVTDRLVTSVPAQSVTLFVLPKSSGPANAAPTAAISATPASGTAPLLVSFRGGDSTDGDGVITSYAWSFGDGATAQGVDATHTYATPGTYTARLTVTDNEGATGTASVTITVTAPPPPPTVPAAPSGLSATAGSNRAVTLTWADNSSTESGFHIERAAKARTLSFSRIATVGVNVRTLSRSEAPGQWVYRVHAFNSAGVSGYSNTATVRVK